MGGWSLIPGSDSGTGLKTTGTAVVTLTTGFAAGDLVVVFWTSDPGTSTGADGAFTTGVPTISDSAGNTYVNAQNHRRGATAAATGIRGGIFYSQITSALSSGSTIQINDVSSVPAKSLTVLGFTG